MQLHSQFTKLIESMTRTLEQLTNLFVSTAPYQQRMLTQLKDMHLPFNYAYYILHQLLNYQLE